MKTGFVIEALAAHDRNGFASGSEPLDRYLRELAAQDVRRRLSNCFVALDEARAVAGYYTLAAASMPLNELPDAEKKRLPRYPLLPACLIGRLAVDKRYQRIGLGGALILDAAMRAARAAPAVMAIVVQAKDEDAAAFYRRFGFRPFAGRPMSLYLPLATALNALEGTR